MERIFISHAVADKQLVDALVDLLQTGLNISKNDIFCSSIEGMNIRTGQPFVQYIKDQLQTSNFALLVISQAYFESAFCLCELGASWVLEQDTFPLIVPPMDFAQLKAISKDVQSRKVDDKDALNDLKDRLDSAGLGNISTARWESKRDTFLKNLATILPSLPKRTTVPVAEYENLKARYEETQSILAEREETIALLKEAFEKLKEAKDKDAVKEILDEHKNDRERFEQLAAELKSATQNLPHIVREVMFKTYDGGHFAPGNWNTDHIWEQVHDAKDRGFLTLDGPQVSLNYNSPKLKAALKLLGELETAMRSVQPGFQEEFEDENDYQFSLTVRDIWEDYLGL